MDQECLKSDIIDKKIVWLELRFTCSNFSDNFAVLLLYFSDGCFSNTLHGSKLVPKVL